MKKTIQKTKTTYAIADGCGDVIELMQDTQEQEKNEKEDDADDEDIDRTYVYFVQKADIFA